MKCFSRLKSDNFKKKKYVYIFNYFFGFQENKKLCQIAFHSSPMKYFIVQKALKTTLLNFYTENNDTFYFTMNSF